jgi:ubiquinone/menaquinone biosynthesis C-methylase UbiE
MRLNWVETLAMNNPLRAAYQRRHEAPGMMALRARPTTASDTLVVGCGRGVDVEIAFEMMGSSRVTAIDIDARQVARASSRLAPTWGERLRLEVGDVARMSFADASFDLVLDFAIIHHVPDWQSAIAEINRVLRPGGQFLFEEIPGRTLDSALARMLTRHPRQNRFAAEEFRRECEHQGFDVGDRFQEFRMISWFAAFRGAAVKVARA